MWDGRIESFQRGFGLEVDAGVHIKRTSQPVFSVNMFELPLFYKCTDLFWKKGID